MLGEAPASGGVDRLIVAVDAFGFADAEVTSALRPAVERLGRLAREVREDVLAPPGLSVWGRAQRTLQPWEAWLTFREWIDRVNPRVAFGVARGLIAGSMIPESERAWAELMRREARARMAHLLPPGTILCLPTTPFPAPLKGQSLSALAPVRDRILCLCAHGGLTGVPQVSVPAATVDGLPAGLSILGPPAPTRRRREALPL
jgi:amidase